MSLLGEIVDTAWMSLASRPPIVTERVGQVKPEPRGITPPYLQLTRVVKLGHPNCTCGISLIPRGVQ
jgi:hypothetical protein